MILAIDGTEGLLTISGVIRLFRANVHAIEKPVANIADSSSNPQKESI